MLSVMQMLEKTVRSTTIKSVVSEIQFVNITYLKLNGNLFKVRSVICFLDQRFTFIDSDDFPVGSNQFGGGPQKLDNVISSKSARKERS